MKAVSALIQILGITLLAGCFTGPRKAAILDPVPEYQESNSRLEVTAYENAENMPEWVARYISTGTAGIETLPEYETSYVFIAKQTGGNLDSLKLWTGGFSLNQDFSRLVSARIQARLTGFAEGNPAEVFGRYFEDVVKKSADTVFTGASQGSSFWIKKQIFNDAGVNSTGETFEYYILVSIEKEILENQINPLLATTRSDLPPTREQSAAAVRLRANFYDGF
jgi:hypothetical protein